MSPLGKHGRNTTSHPVNTGTYLKQIADHFSQAPPDAVVRLKHKPVSIGRREESEPVICCKRFSKTQFKAALGLRKSQAKLDSEQQEAMNQLQAVVARRHGPEVARQIFENMRSSELNAGFVSRLNHRAAAVVALNELGFQAGTSDWDANLGKLMDAMAIKIRQLDAPKDLEFGLEKLARERAGKLHPAEAALREAVIQQVRDGGIYPPPHDSAREQAIRTIMEGALALKEDHVASPLQESAARYAAAMVEMNKLGAYAGDPAEQARALRDLPRDWAFLSDDAALRLTNMQAYAFESALRQHLNQLAHAHNTARTPPTAKETAASKALAQAASDADPAQLTNQVLNADYPCDIHTLELAKKSFQMRLDITPEGLFDARLDKHLDRPNLTPHARHHLLHRAVQIEAERTTKPTDAFGPDSFIAQRLKKTWTASANKPSPFQTILNQTLPQLKANLAQLGQPGLVPEAELIKSCASWAQNLFASKAFLNSLPRALRDDMAQAMDAIDRTTHPDREKLALKMVWFAKVFGQALLEAIDAHGSKGGQPDAQAQEAARILRKLILEPIKTQRAMDGIDPAAAQQARQVWGSFGRLRDALIAP